MNLRSISVRSRLIVLVAFALVLLAAVAVYSLMMEREQMLRDRQEKTRNIVELAHTLATYHAALANSGKMTVAEAQEQTRLAIRHMRFEGENYIVIVDTAVNTIEHPIRPEMNGKSFADFKDANGVRLFVNIVESAKRGKDETTEYLWPKAGNTEPVRKMSASKLFAPWGWVFTTGVYLDDVDAQFNKLASIMAALQENIDFRAPGAAFDTHS